MIIEDLAEQNPDALLADGLEAALVGYTVNHHHQVVAVYDIDKCIEEAMKRFGAGRDRAVQFIAEGALGSRVGENGPLFVRFVGTGTQLRP